MWYQKHKDQQKNNLTIVDVLGSAGHWCAASRRYNHIVGCI